MKKCQEKHRRKRTLLSEKLKEFMIAENLTCYSFSELSGIPVETVRNLYYGRVKDPKISTVLNVSKAIRCSVNDLLGENFLSADEEILINHYRKCGKHGQSLIRLVAKKEATLAKRDNESEKHRIPCLIPVGKMQDGFEYSSSEVIEIETSREDAYSAIQITTNAFAPTFCKGDQVLLADRFPENGEKALFVKEGKGFLREFQEIDSHHYLLKKINTHTPDFEFHRMDEIECIGTYTGVILT